MARPVKNSDIEWIGYIPDDWKVEKAKNHFIQSFSKGNKDLILLSATQSEGVVPKDTLEGVVQVKEDADLTIFKTVHKYNFVISLRSFQGGLEMSNYEGVITPAYSVFRSRDKINYFYFKNLFKSVGFIAKINSLTVGIREGKNIMYEDFANMIIPIPPISKQQEIADYLDSKCRIIDNIIEKQKSVIQKLKSYKQSLITEAVTKGLDPTVKMKPSGIEWIGNIPEGWEIRRLKDIGEAIIGLTYSPIEVSDNGTLVLRSSNIKKRKNRLR